MQAKTQQQIADNLSGGGDIPKVSNGLASFKDTSSLFTISNDSYLQSQQNDMGGVGPGISARSSHRSRRTRRDNGDANHQNQIQKSRKSSKTERAGVQSQAPSDSNNDNESSTNQNQVNKDALRDVKKIVNQRNDKQVNSARTNNNLENWLNKKRAFDQQSKQSSLTNKELNPTDLQQLQHLQNNESDKDLSYLSKLQNSLFFEPGAEFKDKSQLIEQEKLQQMQKSDSQFNLKTQQIQVPQQKTDRSNKIYNMKPIQDQDMINPTLRQSQQSRHINPQLIASNGGSESLLIFNPKEEAILDSYPNMLSLSHNKMLKEVVDHIQRENQYLKEQISDQQELIQMHKQMLVDVISQQSTKLDEFVGYGKSLNQKLNDQRAYLLHNNNLFDNSQVSFMTADLDIHDLDIFKNESSSKYGNQKGQSQMSKQPSEAILENLQIKSPIQSPSGYCLPCKVLIEKEREEFKVRQEELLSVIDQLKQDFANMMTQKDLMLKSSTLSQCQSQKNIHDGENMISARSNSLNAIQQNDLIKSPIHRISSHSRQDSASDNNKYDGIEQALQPLLEKITDPSEELYFQDSNGRVFKIMMCDAQADEEGINQFHQENNDDTGLQQQVVLTEQDELEYVNTNNYNNSMKGNANFKNISHGGFNSGRQSLGTGPSQYTAANSNLASSGIMQSNQKGSILNSNHQITQQFNDNDINIDREEEYYYDEEEEADSANANNLQQQQQQQNFGLEDGSVNKFNDISSDMQIRVLNEQELYKVHNRLQTDSINKDDDYNLLSEGEVENDILNQL
eukprot:403336372